MVCLRAARDVRGAVIKTARMQVDWKYAMVGGSAGQPQIYQNAGRTQSHYVLAHYT